MTASTSDFDGTVVVLSGGLSHERDVSLRSGRRVSQALRDLGCNVLESDVTPELFWMLEQANDQAKPVLANAESLRQEFVRRMRRRAARAWWVAIGAGAVGVIAAVWLTLR